MLFCFICVVSLSFFTISFSYLIIGFSSIFFILLWNFYIEIFLDEIELFVIYIQKLLWVFIWRTNHTQYLICLGKVFFLLFYLINIYSSCIQFIEMYIYFGLVLHMLCLSLISMQKPKWYLDQLKLDIYIILHVW